MVLLAVKYELDRNIVRKIIVEYRTVNSGSVESARRLQGKMKNLPVDSIYVMPDPSETLKKLSEKHGVSEQMLASLVIDYKLLHELKSRDVY